MENKAEGHRFLNASYSSPRLRSLSPVNQPNRLLHLAKARDAKRLLEVEVENNRLKKLLAEAVLNNEALKGGRHKVLSRSAKRRAVGKMMEATSMNGAPARWYRVVV